MREPFIFIATNRLKEGKLDAETGASLGASEFIEKDEPRLIAFNEYVNEEGTEVGVVQVHRDARSMEFHMNTVAEKCCARLCRNARRDHEHPGLRPAERRHSRDAESTGRGGRAAGRQAPSPRRVHTRADGLSARGNHEPPHLGCDLPRRAATVIDGLECALLSMLSSRALCSVAAHRPCCCRRP